jgi:site-specific DNA-adenine methylase
MRYPGGKGGAGVYQTIINLIPPHDVYIEPFVGGGNIFERKAPAASSILVDRDPAIAQLWKQRCHQVPAVTVIEGDAISVLEAREWTGREFIYADPPYVLSTRTKKAIYAHEMSDADHDQLISTLQTIGDRHGVRFMLSGYRNAIYDDAAAMLGWNRVDFQAMTRGGLRTESVWFNYEKPSTIADYSYVGQNFRERERIKRKKDRWIRRLQLLDPLERAALLSAMQDLKYSNTENSEAAPA